MHVNPYANAPRLPDGDAPIDLPALVPGEGPLLLEIGSGRGAFSLEYLVAFPTHRLVAIEVRRKYAWMLADKIAHRKLANGRCYCDDARIALRRLGPAGSVTHVAIHFPDPWWKKRHAKRLVVGDGLVTDLARLVKSGGTVLVQTDVEARATEYLAHFLQAAEGAFVAMSNDDGTPWAAESPFAPARSNRERRAMDDGLPIYRMVFRRV